jgi:DNA-binding transcriptional regulator YiaG
MGEDQVTSDEFRKIRLKFEMNQDQFAELLGMSGKKAISNVETGLRKPGNFIATMLRVLDSMPKRKAEELVELMLKHGKET